MTSFSSCHVQRHARARAYSKCWARVLGPLPQRQRRSNKRNTRIGSEDILLAVHPAFSVALVGFFQVFEAMLALSTWIWLQSDAIELAELCHAVDMTRTKMSIAFLLLPIFLHLHHLDVTLFTIVLAILVKDKAS